MLKKGLLVFVVLAVIAFAIVGGGLYMFSTAPCSFDKKHAVQKVEKYLNERKLPIEFLSFEPSKSEECKFSFLYEGAGQKISFVVIDDFVKGAKLTYWDYNERGE